MEATYSPTKWQVWFDPKATTNIIFNAVMEEKGKITHAPTKKKHVFYTYLIKMFDLYKAKMAFKI
jgi:hypothetical protein